MQTVQIYALKELDGQKRARLKAAQMEAARVWMYCVERHQRARCERTRWPSRDELHRYSYHPKKYMTVQPPAQAVSRQYRRLPIVEGGGVTTRERLDYRWQCRLYYDRELLPFSSWRQQWQQRFHQP